jgi:ACS family glucarate transporter-like MFS transporter
MSFTAKFPYRYRVAILLYFLILITYLDRVTISLVGVRIKTAFHLTNSQFGYALGAFALAYALFEIPSALMGDRLGQRKVFLRIVVWWSFFTALTGAITGLTSLITVRFLFGMGEAGAYPNSTGTVSRWFPKSETSRGISWFSMGSSSGAAVAPLIVVPIAIAFGWRAPFFVNAALGLVWVLICYVWFRNQPSEMKKISQQEKEFIEANRLFVSHDTPFPWKQAFTKTLLWLLVLSYLCVQWANYFFVAWMPNYLQEGKHFSEQEMKMTTTWLFIFGIISSFLAGFFSDWLIRRMGLRFSRRIIAMSCYAIMAILVFLSAKNSNHLAVSFCLISAHFFLPFAVITSFSACVDIGGEHACTIAGIMNFFGQSGAFLMSIFFGRIVDLTHSFDAPQFVMVGVLLSGAILWIGLDVSKKLTLTTTLPSPAKAPPQPLSSGAGR